MPRGFYVRTEAHKDKLRKILRGFDDSKKRKIHQSLGQIGLKHSKESKLKRSKTLKATYIAGYVSPVLGRHRTEDEKRRISEAQIGKKPSYPIPTKVDGLDHLVRSTLERDFFLWLKKTGIDYEYEKMVRVKIDGRNRSYYVDGWIKGTNIYVECKGWFDPYSVKKMIAFRTQNPQSKLIAVVYKRFGAKVPAGCYDRLVFIEELNGLAIKDIIGG